MIPQVYHASKSLKLMIPQVYHAVPNQIMMDFACVIISIRNDLFHMDTLLPMDVKIEDCPHFAVHDI